MGKLLAKENLVLMQVNGLYSVNVQNENKAQKLLVNAKDARDAK